MDTTGETKAAIFPGVGPVPAETVMRLWNVLSQRDDRQKFWASQSGWPRDAMGKVFLARAVQRMGAFMYGEAWTGYEPAVDLYLSPLPVESWLARPADRSQVQKLLGLGNPTNRYVPRDHVSQPDWLRGRALVDETLDLLRPARARLRAVKERLIEAMLSGSLRYCLRIDEQGDFTEALPERFWNTEKTDPRFYFCRLNRAEPISIAVAGGGYRHIFVWQEDLDALVAKPPSEPEAPARGKGGPRTRQQVAAESLCAKWLVEEYMKPSPDRATHPRAALRELAFKHESFGKDLSGSNAFNRAWAEAAGSGPFSVWREGGDTRAN